MPTVIGLVVVLALALPWPARASSDLTLRDYIHTVWTLHDGMPLGRVSTIVQTPDGYLWVIAREHGLLRFDGMRFVAPQTPCKTLVAQASTAPDGTLWALCGAQLIRRTASGRFEEVPQKFLPPQGTPNERWHVDRHGTVWFVGKSIRTFVPGSDPVETPRPTRVQTFTSVFDAAGDLWISDVQEVMRLAGDEKESMNVQGVWCLAAAPTDGVYAVSPRRIWRLRKGAPPVEVYFVTETSEIRPTIGGPPTCAAEDPDGNLWIGTRQHGAALLRNGAAETLPDIDKTGRSAGTIFIDREKNIWVGAITGLQRFRKPTVKNIPAQSRYLGGSPQAVFVDSRDTLWLSPSPTGGMTRLNMNDGSSANISLGGQPTAVGEDADGRIWVSDGGNIGTIVNDKFVVVRDAANEPVKGISAFRKDGRGLWAQGRSGVVYRVTPGPPRLEMKVAASTWDFFVSEQFGLWIGHADGSMAQHIDGRINVFFDGQPKDDPVRARAFATDGESLWVTTDQGLRRLRKGQWTTWTHEHGVPGDFGAEDVLFDRAGYVWILTNGGLMRLPRAQLDATPDGAPAKLTYALIGAIDGMIPSGGIGPATPRTGIDSRGRLYFPTSDSVIIIDPAAITPAIIEPPPIVLDSVTVDHRAAGLTGAQSFVEPALVQFDYTSLSLRNPELARFRYRLEGHDPDWIEANSQRRVTYGMLPPGSYTFRVIGAGAEGVWNETGASFAFQIVPIFWRTWWFRLAALAVVALVAAGLYRLRVRQLERQFAAAADARVNERTRIARDLHDTLLQTFQGVLIHFQAATNLLPSRPDDAKHKLSGVLDHATRAITEARDAVHELRSAGAADDLAKAISVVGDELAGAPGDAASATIRVNVDGSARNLRPALREDVYRIACEAMRNAVRHAQARTIRVDIHYGDRSLQVRVRDDGKGIESATLEAQQVDGHWGLPGMRERAALIGGTLEVRSQAGSGTEIDLTVPAAKAYPS